MCSKWSNSCWKNVGRRTLGCLVYRLSFYLAALLCKISALRSFSLDKLHYQRERESGVSSLAYFLSKDTVDHFNTLIKPVVFLSLFYSFNIPRSTFLENYVVLLCLVYCVTGIAYVLAIFLQPSQAQLVTHTTHTSTEFTRVLTNANASSFNSGAYSSLL